MLLIGDPMQKAYGVKIGELNQRISVEVKSATQAENGEDVVSWSEVVKLWAKAQQLAGRERIAASQVQFPADVRFVIRNRAGITPEQHRIVWRGQPYEIVGQPAEVGPHREWLEIMATAGIRDGR